MISYNRDGMRFVEKMGGCATVPKDIPWCALPLHICTISLFPFWPRKNTLLACAVSALESGAACTCVRTLMGRLGRSTARRLPAQYTVALSLSLSLVSHLYPSLLCGTENIRLNLRCSSVSLTLVAAVQPTEDVTSQRLRAHFR